MKLISQSFADQQPIPGAFAFGIPHERDHVCPGGNRNPHLEWHDLPAGTQSLALICHDPDVPTRGDDVNKEGRTVPSACPGRMSFIGC